MTENTESTTPKAAVTGGYHDYPDTDEKALISYRCTSCNVVPETITSVCRNNVVCDREMTVGDPFLRYTKLRPPKQSGATAAFSRVDAPFSSSDTITFPDISTSLTQIHDCRAWAPSHSSQSSCSAQQRARGAAEVRRG